MANPETRPAGPASDKAAIRVRYVPRTGAHRRWRMRTYTVAVGMDHDLQEVAGAARDQQPRIEPRQRRAHVLHGPAGRAAISETGGAGALLSRSTGAGAAAAPASHASRRAARISVWPLCRRLPVHAVCGLTGQGSARAQLYQCWLGALAGPVAPQARGRWQRARCWWTCSALAAGKWPATRSCLSGAAAAARCR